jgi:hypothetical protein
MTGFNAVKFKRAGGQSQMQQPPQKKASLFSGTPRRRSGNFAAFYWHAAGRANAAIFSFAGKH